MCHMQKQVPVDSAPARRMSHKEIQLLPLPSRGLLISLMRQQIRATQHCRGARSAKAASALTFLQTLHHLLFTLQAFDPWVRNCKEINAFTKKIPIHII